MRIAFGTDEQTAVTDVICRHLVDAGHEVMVVGGDGSVDAKSATGNGARDAGDAASGDDASGSGAADSGYVGETGTAAPWPTVGRAVGQTVASGEAEIGVVCCWTGTGVSIAANKVAGVRAALCTDAETARGARRWNDANVLAIGLRLTSLAVAVEMLEAFIDTDVDTDETPLIAQLEPD